MNIFGEDLIEALGTWLGSLLAHLGGCLRRPECHSGTTLQQCWLIFKSRDLDHPSPLGQLLKVILSDLKQFRRPFRRSFEDVFVNFWCRFWGFVLLVWRQARGNLWVELLVLRQPQLILRGDLSPEGPPKKASFRV